MAPVAARTLLYEPGTPQRALQDAIGRRYGTARGAMRDFFQAVATEAHVTTGTAKGTYNAFLRGDRSLPAEHRRAYIKLTGVKASTLDEIQVLRDPEAATPRGRGHLQELGETVEDLLKWRDKTNRSLARLRARVRKLEDQPSDGGVAATRPRKAGP